MKFQHYDLGYLSGGETVVVTLSGNAMNVRLMDTSTLVRASERKVILVRDLRAALKHLNPELPESAREQAVEKLTRVDFARSLIQHKREFYDFIRNGVPVDWRDAEGLLCDQLME